MSEESHRCHRVIKGLINYIVLIYFIYPMPAEQKMHEKVVCFCFLLLVTVLMTVHISFKAKYKFLLNHPRKSVEEQRYIGTPFLSTTAFSDNKYVVRTITNAIMKPTVVWFIIEVSKYWKRSLQV